MGLPRARIIQLRCLSALLTVCPIFATSELAYFIVARRWFLDLFLHPYDCGRTVIFNTNKKRSCRSHLSRRERFSYGCKVFCFRPSWSWGRKPKQRASDCPAPFAPSCWAFHERQISPWGSHPFKHGGRVRKNLANISACQARGGRNRTRTCDPIDVNDVLYHIGRST